MSRANATKTKRCIRSFSVDAMEWVAVNPSSPALAELLNFFQGLQKVAREQLAPQTFELKVIAWLATEAPIQEAYGRYRAAREQAAQVTY